MWHEGVDIGIQNSSGEFIDITCGDKDSRSLVQISFIYAPTNFTNNLPWICVGDFNEILYYREKEGRREVYRYKLVVSWEFSNDCLLMDIKNNM